MHLIDESKFSEFEILKESDNSLPPGVIARGRGPIGITEAENKNGRWYSNDFWESILNNPETQKSLKERSMVGSADHPSSYLPPFHMISHVITDAKVDRNSNALLADFDILDTPMGKIVKTLFDAKVKVGASTRALGKTKLESGRNKVQKEGYHWGGFDFVLDPSCQNAYPSIKENIEKIIAESSCDTLFSSKESIKDTVKLYENFMNKFGCDTKLLFEKAQQVDSLNEGLLQNNINALQYQQLILDSEYKDSLSIISGMEIKIKELSDINEDNSKKLDQVNLELENSKKEISSYKDTIEKLSTKINFLKELYLESGIDDLKKVQIRDESTIESKTNIKEEVKSQSSDTKIEGISSLLDNKKDMSIDVKDDKIISLEKSSIELKKLNRSLTEKNAQLVLQLGYDKNMYEVSLNALKEKIEDSNFVIESLKEDLGFAKIEIDRLRKPIKEYVEIKKVSKVANKVASEVLDESPINATFILNEDKKDSKKSDSKIRNNVKSIYSSVKKGR
jgi:hypothetical protein